MSQPDASPATTPAGALREIRHESSRNLVPLLAQLGSSLLVSTYHAGKLIVASSLGDQLNLAFHNFDRTMGLAVSPKRLAVGDRTKVWFLNAAHDLAPRLPPVGRHDGCFLTRAAHVTGEVQLHEMAWGRDELWLVNTAFSCLCTLDGQHNFVPRWHPPFITALAPGDRCHLNGLALEDGQPRYVTFLGASDTAGGWRPGKAQGGCVFDLTSNTPVIQGLCMPHSPRLHNGRLYLLDSGRGALVAADPATGRVETLAELPGFTRGLTLAGDLAFVGLSRIRETSTFGGIPIAERREQLKCGVAVVELSKGRLLGLLEFASGVEEIFDVALLPGIRFPALHGPHPDIDGSAPIWTVPEPTRADAGPRPVARRASLSNGPPQVAPRGV